MARIMNVQEPKPVIIDKFLGYNNEETGDTQLKLGESGNMKNYYITKNWKLKSIEGYKELFTPLGAKIQGMFYGAVGGTNYFVFACNGNLYKCINGVNTLLGTITNAPTTFFTFDNKLYIMNGYEYKVWNGTTLADVAGYIPVIAISTPSTGGGTDAQQLNLLTGKKEQWFNGNGATATFYQLRETAIDAVEAVYVNEVLQTVTTHYTVDLANGKVLPVTPENWTVGNNNIRIIWRKGTGSRSLIVGHKASMLFGPGNKTSVFIYGNTSEQNRFRYSGITYNGLPTAEYFPSNNYSDQDSLNFPITDMKRTQANYFIIFKSNIARYGRYDILIDTTGGEQVVYRTFDLNGVVGNVAFNQTQVLDDTIHSIMQNSLHRWESTSVEAEKNAPRISSRIRADLNDVDMSTAITYDYQERSEWWIAIGKTIYIYNYELMTQSQEDGNRNVGTYSKLELPDTISSMIVIDGVMHLGTTNGAIMKFDADENTFNGTLIHRYWEMNFYDFMANWLRKSMHRFWIQLKPGTRESLDIRIVTNKGNETGTGINETIEYKVFNYGDINYADWSYLTSLNPQPFRIKRKAKKFTNLKLVFDNTNLDSATILNIIIKFSTQGESK